MESKTGLRFYSSVEKREIEWLWYPYIPCGKITVLQGDPGEGKSTFIINVVALLTQGEPMPDGSDGREPMQVLYQCAEDDVADTVKPRLLAAGADCGKVAFIEDGERTLTLDDERIEQAIIDSGAKLLVLDPLQAYLPQDSDMQSAQRMRGVLRRLADIATKRACAVVLVGHLNKAAGKSIYRGLGSIDIAAIARSVLLIERDCDNPTMRYMHPIKASLAPEGPTIGFSIGDEQGFSWAGPCEYTIDNAESEQGKRGQAANEIQRILSAGETESLEVLARLTEKGISRRTAQTAKKDLGIEAIKRGSKWYWRMPVGDEETDEDAEETTV